MRQFYDAYRDDEKVAPLVRQLPWTHNLIILSQSKRAEEREFYLRAAARERWSKRELERQFSVALFERALGWGRWVALVLAFVISSLAFSAVHHIPPYGDPLTVGVFTFRALAGVCFGLLYWFRGFAVAVYTHALYDVYVLLLR